LSVGWDYQRSTCVGPTKFEMSTFTHYEDMKGDKNAQKLG